MTYTPGHVANFMLDRAEREDRGLSSMKLLKLVYIGYGWNLAVLDRSLFDESIHAWAHGPVVRSLYHEFKHYGRQSIRERSIDFDLDQGEVIIPTIPADDEQASIVLSKVWDVYKHFSAWALREKTHEPGTPWSQVYKKGQNDIRIPDKLIATHFQQKIRQYIDDAREAAA